MMNLDDFKKFDSKEYKRYVNPQLLEKDMRMLVGIIQGISSDGKINELEHKALQSWINGVREYQHKKPYYEITDAIREAINDDVITYEELRNIVWLCTQYLEKKEFYTYLTAGIQSLSGILKGIVADKEINEKEIRFLNEWISENSYLKSTYPYDEIDNLLTKILNDKVVSKNEQEEFLQYATLWASDYDNNKNDKIVESLKMGFCQIDPQVIIQDNLFCITGISQKYKRKDIAAKIELFGGYVTDKITKKLNYLVVCDNKNSCWAYSTHGNKVQEVVSYRKQGQNIVIIHEFDLYDAIEELG